MQKLMIILLSCIFLNCQEIKSFNEQAEIKNDKLLIKLEPRTDIHSYFESIVAFDDRFEEMELDKDFIKKHSKEFSQLIAYCLENKEKWSKKKYHQTIRFLIELPIDTKIKDKLTLNLIKRTNRLDIHFFDEKQFIKISDKIYKYLKNEYKLKTVFEVDLFLTLRINKEQLYLSGDIYTLIEKNNVIVVDQLKSYVKSIDKYKSMPKTRFAKHDKKYAETHFYEYDDGKDIHEGEHVH